VLFCLFFLYGGSCGGSGIFLGVNPLLSAEVMISSMFTGGEDSCESQIIVVSLCHAQLYPYLRVTNEFILPPHMTVFHLFRTHRQ
jgi:hypothetical protein